VTSSTQFLTLAMRGHISFVKSMSGTIKFISILDRMNMKLHSKLGSFPRIKTRFLRGSML